jgi:hypothetical protein
VRLLFGDLFPLAGRHPSRPRLAAHAPERHGGGVLAGLRGYVLDLAGRIDAKALSECAIAEVKAMRSL